MEKAAANVEATASTTLALLTTPEVTSIVRWNG
jgi:hypothetical protein